MILTGLFGYCWAESGAGATRVAAVASNTYGSMRFSPIIRVPSCLVMRCSLSQCSEAPSDAERELETLKGELYSAFCQLGRSTLPGIKALGYCIDIQSSCSTPKRCNFYEKSMPCTRRPTITAICSTTMTSFD